MTSRIEVVMIGRPALIVLATAVATATVATAETVYLRGGGKVQGEVVADSPSGLVLEVGPGQVTIARARILRIDAGRSPVGEFEARARELSAGDVAGWLALARWAEEHDLASQADRAFGHVIRNDPDNRDAHAGLGHVQVDGRWLSFEDAQRARGLVELDGQWMSPAAREALGRDRSLEDARRQSARESDARAREAEARASEAEAAARKAEAEAAASGDGGIPIGLVGIGPQGAGRRRHGDRARPCAHQARGCGPEAPSPTAAPSPIPPVPVTIRGPDSTPPPSRKSSSGTSSVGSRKDRTSRPPSSHPSPKP